eukprot:6257858-Amphidinium_carterae.1
MSWRNRKAHCLPICLDINPLKLSVLALGSWFLRWLLRRWLYTTKAKEHLVLKQQEARKGIKQRLLQHSVSRCALLVVRGAFTESCQQQEKNGSLSSQTQITSSSCNVHAAMPAMASCCLERAARVGVHTAARASRKIDDSLAYHQQTRTTTSSS